MVLAWSLHPIRLLELGLGPIFAGEPSLQVTAEITQRLLEAGRDQPWVDSIFLGLPGLLRQRARSGSIEETSGCAPARQ